MKLAWNIALPHLKGLSLSANLEFISMNWNDRLKEQTNA